MLTSSLAWQAPECSLTLTGTLSPQVEIHARACSLWVNNSPWSVGKGSGRAVTFLLWVPGVATAATLFPLLQGEERHPTPSQIATPKYSSRARVAQGSLESWGSPRCSLGSRAGPQELPTLAGADPSRAEAEGCSRRPGWDSLFPSSCQAYLGPASTPLSMLPLLPARSFPGFKAFVSPRNVSSHCL